MNPQNLRLGLGHKILNYILLLIYRWFILPLILCAAFTFGFWLVPKIRLGFRLRQMATRRTKPLWCGKTAPLWIHAASGEFEYAKAVIREVKQGSPQTRILVTYFSPTYAKNIESFPEVDWCEPLPIDTRAAVQSFFQKWKPQLLLISRTDLWPELLTQCQKAQIPSILFSATFSGKKSLSLWRRPLWRWLLSLLSEIHLVSQKDQKNLQQMNLEKLTKYYVTGDTRYDQVLYRLGHPRPLNFQIEIPPAQSLLVAGSTWPEDEAVLLPAMAPFLTTTATTCNNTDLKDGGGEDIGPPFNQTRSESSENNKSLAQPLALIIAPHEPTKQHLEHLAKQLISYRLPFVLYSQMPRGSTWTGLEVLIIDQVGILADLYSKGSLAFVGGSFRRSVHSVMEPLAAGALTFVGPHHLNNREAIEFKSIELNFNDILSLKTNGTIHHLEKQSETNLHMVQAVSTSQEWKLTLNQWLKQKPTVRLQLKRSIIATIEGKTGASRKLVTHLMSDRMMA